MWGSSWIFWAGFVGSLLACTDVQSQVYKLRALNCEARCVAIESDTNTVLTAAHAVSVDGITRPNIEVFIGKWERAELKYISRYKDLAVLELRKDLVLNKIKIARKTPPENSPISIIGTKSYSGVYIGRYVDQLSLDSTFVPNGIVKGDSGGAVMYNYELIGIATSFSFISNQSAYFVRREGIEEFVSLYKKRSGR